MNIIIVSHTEFGFVHNKYVIADKKKIDGVSIGVPNLIKIADKYGAKITFVVMPEIVNHFPKNINHEIGLHIHPGSEEYKIYGFRYTVGDLYLREHCEQTGHSTVLKDYNYKEQLDMIKTGKECLYENFEIEPRVFVAGRWSINNNTIKALIKTGLTHDCSAIAHTKQNHYDWSKLPRICMPYNPDKEDYQETGDQPLLIVPISQYYPSGNMNPEVIPYVGLGWLKACFLEYYKQNLPVFHICLHSGCMTDPYFISAFDELLKFISKYNIEFKFASEIQKYDKVETKTLISQYIFGINRDMLKSKVFKNSAKLEKIQ